MIWFDRAEYFEGQPKNFIVGLEGRFDEAKRKVSLHLMMFGGNDVEFELWSKLNGSSLAHEEVTPDDIYNKYSGKVAKILEELPKKFGDLITLFEERLSAQSGHPVYFDHQSMQWFANASDLPEDSPLG